MKLNTFILALTLAASVQVLAEEITLGVYHKLSGHETYEKRGEIRFDADEWFSYKQQREQPTPSSTGASKQKHQRQQQQQQKQKLPPIEYHNIELTPSASMTLAEEFILNVQAPIIPREPEEEPQEKTTDENGIMESQEEFDQRVTDWKSQQEELEDEDLSLKTPGSYGFYQIQLRDDSRKWDAMSSIKSCLLLASDFQEEITLHLDQNREVFAFDYYTGAYKCEDEHKKEFPLTSLDHFKNVKVDVATGHAGPKARYVRAQAVKMDETGNPAVEKSFLQKYWMYIVPALVIMMFTGGEPEKTAA
ncbi:hypothetical protein BG011_008951 [Mortierella polycephala]|uniref:ER membrane protein complex subunit 10 n=1 Tax=Mortierella polycephala TaxID=41804 RepID=A0A9P6U7S8_9FUNG|nr:hypothetical protein BG011_008951 [Mortierella polycephala]